ncbi:MAG: adenosylmethionine decarboxylase [Spirochaetia bacterium]|uniref:Adenosylmethionine decarboxylase n=1 Tax=uncultured spirochete TaxID=156406 RepID=A0A3P3XHR6_9SPIR|nr:adenosylmethionine decarboxylase [Rectinema subterraneum]MDQ7796420.1 adenosylmethionine decarboxylase [Spirochaetia bacterium]SLM11888.1 S-adenosylmethionine decarboxylase [uncultured spirochete]
MVRRVKGKTLKLEGFNNLTKSISFNIYDICYARSRESQIEYLEYVDEEYNSKRLEEIVENVTRMINAKLVSVSTQDYDPRGASVVALINEGSPVADEHIKSDKEQTGPAPFVIGHLDKSHIAIHTYPEYHRLTGLASFRVDIDISTCGMISPLSALNYLIESFDSEVVIIDYRVRGFTRDHKGRKVFIDHDISSIQDYIDQDILERYITYDINILSDNNFHTKMRKKEIRLKDFLFGDEVTSLDPKEKERIRRALLHEIQEIFECRNLNMRSGRL